MWEKGATMIFGCYNLNAKSYVHHRTFEEVLVWSNDTNIYNDRKNESEIDCTGRRWIKESTLKTQQKHSERIQQCKHMSWESAFE